MEFKKLVMDTFTDFSDKYEYTEGKFIIEEEKAIELFRHIGLISIHDSQIQKEIFKETKQENK